MCSKLQFPSNKLVVETERQAQKVSIKNKLIT